MPQARRDPAIRRPERRRVEVADDGARDVRILVEECEQAIHLAPPRVHARKVGPGVRSQDVDVDDLHGLGDLTPVSGREARREAVATRQRQSPHLGRAAARDAEAAAQRVRRERAFGQLARDRLRQPRAELLDAEHVDVERSQRVGERDRIGPVVAEIRAEDSEAAHAVAPSSGRAPDTTDDPRAI
jgi:hypothetical protein